MAVDATVVRTEAPVSVGRPGMPVLATGTLMLAMACVSFYWADLQLPANPSFMPAFGALTSLVDLLTCILLFIQARSAHDHDLRRLGTAYLFSFLSIVPHLAAFPNVFAAGSLIGTSASAVWLWCVWHAGFALCVARYAILAQRTAAAASSFRLFPTISITSAIVLALTCVATAGVAQLPTILVGSGFGRLNAMGIGPFVILCNLGALLVTVVGFRGRTTLAQWLTVSLIASSLDVVLTLLGAGRFTLGWYVARCLSLATGVCVLVALLSELTRLYAATASMNRNLEALSLTDGLTGLPNRRSFDATLDREWRRALRRDELISVMMIDIDHFKSLNDRFGHPAGDTCLREVAQAIGGSPMRGSDFAARFGGEEFVVLLPNTDAAGALRIGELVRSAVEALDVRHDGQALGPVTVSIGCASRMALPGEKAAAELLAAADAALYAAKREGRNRVMAEQRVAPDMEAALPGTAGRPVAKVG